MPGRDKEDLDRELEELLQELRIALPGVQILFAFLLAVPFQNRFARIDQLDKIVYFVALMSSLAAVAFFILPTTYHRIRFRDYDKERIVKTSSRAAIVGAACLAIGLTASAFLVTDLLFETVLASVFTAIVAASLAWLWFGLPVSRKLRDHRAESRSR
jgi:amino acid transporter